MAERENIKRWAKALFVGLAAAIFAAVAAGVICILFADFVLLSPPDSMFTAVLLLVSPIVGLALLAWGFMVGFFVFLFALSRL